MSKPRLASVPLMPQLRSVALLLALSGLTACTGSDFTAKAGKKGATPTDHSDGATTGQENSADAANAGGLPGTDAAAARCSGGCCPTIKAAFVDCSSLAGARAAKVSRGPFDITGIGCSQIQASLAALNGYDTVIYYGPLNHGQAAGLPAAIEAALNAGAKVIAFPTADVGLADHAFYGLTLETNLEFISNIGGSKVSVTNPNLMSNAFSTSRYATSTLSHLMFLGPFLLVDPSTFTAELESHWCSDLTARSALQVQLTAFHGFLYDNGPRRGLLIASTVSAPGGLGTFDFSDPFLAAHLKQPWSRTGNSKQCGLSCTAASTDGTGFARPTGVGKPVLYLYPTKERDIDVKLEFDGQLVTTYPKYNPSRKGWRVRARPNGQMIDADDHQEYSYIYWSGTTNAMKTSFAEGFVVKGEDTRRFLRQTLAQMGMTPREYNDMIVYWLPYMERHPYNLISFAQESYTDVARMTITPKPDALLRVFMEFKALAEPIEVKPQRFAPFNRKGFVAVEWGGSEIDGDWHVVQ